MAEENNIENLKLEVENLRKQRDEYLNGWKRAKADYLNLKREMESQNKEIKEWMSKIMLLPLLEIMDNLEKAFLEIPARQRPEPQAVAGGPENLTDNQWIKGIENIKKQFGDYLKAQGVEAMAAKGEKFDPLKHEAVENVEGGESGKIAEELQSGYLIRGEVLRPTKVKVYK